MKRILTIVYLLSFFIAAKAKTVSELHVVWSPDTVMLSPLNIKGIDFCTDSLKTYLKLSVQNSEPLDIILSGSCENGRLCLETENACSLVLDGLNLTSLLGPVLYAPKAGSVSIRTRKGTKNYLRDDSVYKVKNAGMSKRSCIYCKGPLVFDGEGTLDIAGTKRHAIKCGSNVTIRGGILNIDVSRKEAKGIDCLTFVMDGGTLNGKGCGNHTYKDSTFVRSMIIRSQGDMTLNGGELNLTHTGKGAYCLHTDANLFVKGGDILLTCTGEGGYYGSRPRGRHDYKIRDYRTYYSSDCISVKKNCYIIGGNLTCQNTGKGGKAINVKDQVLIGETASSCDTITPRVNLITSGDCIYSEKGLDYRDGCPKALRAHSTTINGGNIRIETEHIGGEGLESDSIVINGGCIMCNTFDDGINVKNDITINGGYVYCNSTDNDAIDSNGTLHINDGVVVGISQHPENESFDAEQRQVYITGGTVFSISNSFIKMQSNHLPMYNTGYGCSVNSEATSHAFKLTGDEYISVMDEDKVLVSLKNTAKSDHAFFTISCPEMKEGKEYTMYTNTKAPIRTKDTYFDKNLIVGGKISTKDGQLLATILAQPWENILKKKSDETDHNREIKKQYIQ